MVGGELPGTVEEQGVQALGGGPGVQGGERVPARGRGVGPGAPRGGRRRSGRRRPVKIVALRRSSRTAWRSGSCKAASYGRRWRVQSESCRRRVPSPRGVGRVSDPWLSFLATGTWRPQSLSHGHSPLPFPRISRILSIDIGGTGIKADVLDAEGNPLAERVRIKTPTPAAHARGIDGGGAAGGGTAQAAKLQPGVGGLSRRGPPGHGA